MPSRTSPPRLCYLPVTEALADQLRQRPASECPDRVLEGTEDVVSYPAFVDEEAGAYGVVFSDLHGCVAMGHSVDEALEHAEEALRDYVCEMGSNGWEIEAPTAPESLEAPEGNRLVFVPLIRSSSRRVRIPIAERVSRSPSNRFSLR